MSNNKNQNFSNILQVPALQLGTLYKPLDPAVHRYILSITLRCWFYKNELLFLKPTNWKYFITGLWTYVGWLYGCLCMLYNKHQLMFSFKIAKKTIFFNGTPDLFKCFSKSVLQFVSKLGTTKVYLKII